MEQEPNRLLRQAEQSLASQAERLAEARQHMSWLLRSDMGESVAWLINSLCTAMKDAFFEQDDMSDKERWQVKGVLIAYQGLIATMQGMSDEYEASVSGDKREELWAPSEEGL